MEMTSFEEMREFLEGLFFQSKHLMAQRFDSMKSMFESGAELDALRLYNDLSFYTVRHAFLREWLHAFENRNMELTKESFLLNMERHLLETAECFYRHPKKRSLEIKAHLSLEMLKKLRKVS